jgi:CHAD domain-containing protein
VPGELLDEVRAFVRDAPAAPIASVHTDRTERHLFDGEGNDLAVAADDLVHSRRLTSGPVELSSWRELEVELVEGDEAVLGEVDQVLVDAGLDPSPYPSKLHHALGWRAEPTNEGAILVGPYVHEQIAELLARDADARADRPDGVHKMRVAVRRLRSALATFRPLFETDDTEPVRDELQWLGTILGGARDVEVQQTRLRDAAHALPVELRVGPVIDRIDISLGRRRRESQALLLEALQSARYYELLDRLDALLVDLATDAAASRGRTDGTDDDPPLAVVRRRVRHSVKRVRRAARAAAHAPETERTRALHEVRKAAKRSRYAAEAARPLLGAKAKKLGRRMEAVQDVLGDVQDAVTSLAILRQLGVSTAHVDSENGFTFGVLHEQQHHAMLDAMAKAPRVVRRATGGW